MNFGPVPPVLPPGAEFAVLSGDPSKRGHFVVAIRGPQGYTVPPHWHSTDEHVTVLSGRFLVGMGDSVDTKQTMSLGQDGFVTAPAQAHHFAVAARKTVVQVNGEGPFAITYVRASDDPRGTNTSSR